MRSIEIWVWQLGGGDDAVSRAPCLREKSFDEVLAMQINPQDGLRKVNVAAHTQTESAKPPPRGTGPHRPPTLLCRRASRVCLSPFTKHSRARRRLRNGANLFPPPPSDRRLVGDVAGCVLLLARVLTHRMLWWPSHQRLGGVAGVLRGPLQGRTIRARYMPP